MKTVFLTALCAFLAGCGTTFEQRLGACKWSVGLQVVHDGTLTNALQGKVCEAGEGRASLVPAIRATWGGKTYVITHPDKALWSESEIARAGVSTNGPFWPMLAGAGKAHQCAQMRLRGEAGDRTNRNYLVVCSLRHWGFTKAAQRARAEHAQGDMIKPEAKFFRREDPFGGR